MRLHYLQHARFEGPGAIQEWAERRGHEVTSTHTYVRDFTHPGDFDMLIVLGGPMNVDQEREYPWLAQEKAFIRAAIDEGKPVLGICLGAQMLASVLGAAVTAGTTPEIGWYAVDLTSEGRESAMMGGFPERFDALHWHGDTFAIPEGAVRTAASAVTPNQAFEYAGGRVVGLQFHIEATPGSWGALCEACADHLTMPGEWISSAEAMLGKRALMRETNELLFGLLDRMAARYVAL